MRISDWSSDVCSSDLGSPTQALRVDTAEPGHIARGPWVLSAMRSALLSQQAFDGGRRGLCDLGIVRGLHAGNTNAAEFCPRKRIGTPPRSEEHTSELQSLMRISYAVFCLKKKNKTIQNTYRTNINTRIKQTT